jgi:transcriptional regulator with XRE-family HTH domain
MNGASPTNRHQLVIEAGEGERLSPPPSEAQARGGRLRDWLKLHDFDQASFAREMGVSKPMIANYVSGRVDISSMQQKTVEKLLAAMQVSDSWAWQYFDIPVELRPTWRTFRPSPWGHGDEPLHIDITLVLDAPLYGEGWTLPSGTVVTYDADVRDRGLLLTRLPGRYIVAQPDALPAGPGVELLGSLRSSSPG